MAYVKNRAKVEKQVRASMANFQKRLSRGIEEVCQEIDDTIKAHTPVNTGKAVRNYNWSAGAPDYTVHEAIDNGPTGPTNSMQLGAEPRRDVNERAAAASLARVDFSNPFQAFFLTNSADDIEGLEFGLLPTPEKSRSPNGMFGLTQNYISELVRSKGFLR